MHFSQKINSSLTVHLQLHYCDRRQPPGDEIYRDGNLSVYEVDGKVNKVDIFLVGISHFFSKFHLL